jgi:hypothetical protein
VLDDVRRVAARRQPDDLELDAAARAQAVDVAQRDDAAGHRLLPGRVRVLAEQRGRREPRQRAHLPGRQRRAHRADHLGDPRLAQRDRVGVALDEHHATCTSGRRAGEIDAVEHLVLVEHVVVGRVEVLRPAIVGPQRTRAEPQHPAALVAQREHDPAAEAIDHPAAVAARLRQPAPQQLLLRVPGAPRRLHHPVERGGREPDAVLAQRALLQPAPGEVRAGRRGLAALPQHADVVGGGALQQRQQPVGALAAGRRRRVLGLALELHPVAVGERLQRAREVEPLGLHHEREDIAPRAAAEAVVELLHRVDPERRRPLVVERTEPLEPLRARPPQLGAGPDQLLEVDRVADALPGVLCVPRH